jgi:hypothetical protein
VVVNATGNVKLTWNEAQCAQRLVDAPFWPCQTGSPLSAFGPDPWDSGPLQVYATYADGGSGAVRLRASGSAGDGGGSAVGLYYAERPGSFVGHVNMIAVWAWDPTFGNGPYSWNVTGGYTVTATAVPAPFQVTESGPDASGTVTYTVEPLYDLRFSSPVAGWPAGATFWAFYPGDSLPDQPDRSWPGWEITECQFQLVCQWKPPVPGRMQVLAHLEGQPAYMRSKPAPGQCQHAAGPMELQSVRASASGGCGEQEPKLVLKCDGQTDARSVVRGNRMECTAEPEPAGAAVTGLQWEFRDEQGHTIPGPAGEAKWGGIMVVVGEMKVSGSVNGKPQAPTLPVTVTARDWTGKITFPAEPQPEWTKGPPLVYPPTIQGDTLADGTLGRSTWAFPEPASGYAQGSGPNEGWYYLDAPPYFSPRESHIYYNEALKPSDPFYRAQRGNSGAVAFGRRACGSDFMAHAARHIPVHESGHYSRAKTLTESPAGAAMLEIAIVYGADPAEDSTAYRSMFRPYLAADKAQQDEWDRRSVLDVPCQLTVPTN